MEVGLGVFGGLGGKGGFEGGLVGWEPMQQGDPWVDGWTRYGVSFLLRNRPPSLAPQIFVYRNIMTYIYI